MSHNFMSYIQGSVKKGLGQMNFSDKQLHYILTGMSHTIYYVTHSGERKEELRRFNGDKKKNF